MNLPVIYVIYTVISFTVTVWVARILHRRGRAFLVACFHGNERLADSVNALLVLGFYLLNFTYVTLALRYGTKPIDLTESIVYLATKVGLVLMLLSSLHYFNLLIFTWIAKHWQEPKTYSGHLFRSEGPDTPH